MTTPRRRYIVDVTPEHSRSRRPGSPSRSAYDLARDRERLSQAHSAEAARRQRIAREAALEEARRRRLVGEET